MNCLNIPLVSSRDVRVWVPVLVNRLSWSQFCINAGSNCRGIRCSYGNSISQSSNLI